MKRVLLACFLVLPAVPSGSQSAPPDDPATKAFEAIAKSRGKSWAGAVEAAFVGFAYLAEGSTLTSGKYSAELRKCVEQCMQDGMPADQKNWYLAFRLFFLSEVYKKEQTDQIKEKLAALVKEIPENQEPSGGFSHRKGFVYTIGNLRVPDVCIVGAMMIAGMGNAKSCGVELPAGVLERTLKYVEKLGGGGGLPYGTNNPVPDYACSRAAGVLMGLHFMGQRSGMYSSLANGVRSSFSSIEQGHAFPPIHFFNSAVGNYLVGNYAAWKNHWLGKLLNQREPDGSLWMKNKENIDYERTQFHSNTISTAVLAMLCHLDKGHVFQPFRPKRKASDDKNNGASGKKPSPFARPKPKNK